MHSYLNPLSTDYLESLEKQYRENPDRIESSWRYFFDGLALGHDRHPDKSGFYTNLEFEIKVLHLIQAYRELGHLIADVNPLLAKPQTTPLLELSNFGLTSQDLDKTCHVGRVLGFGDLSLKEIIRILTDYYASYVTVEYGHIEEPLSRQWIQSHVESNWLKKPLATDEKKSTLKILAEAQIFEDYLHRHFVGQKRFSIEGCEALIPMLDFLIHEASQLGADELILGMAHRGRLNVLAHVFEKDLSQIMAEFQGNLDVSAGDGDVKYHMGFSSTKNLNGRSMHLSLLPNPSHLEAINSVLLGVTRSKQKQKGDTQKTKTLPLLIHGEASFSGQGVVYETLTMSELAGYTVGGTIHIVINNQIGYTTLPNETRSAPQATDIAKMLEIPIFRANANHVESCIRCILLALRFRYQFKRDVVIDLMGYRRYGHNEGDEPAFTQPLMYQIIKNEPPVLEIYSQKLIQEQTMEAPAIQAIKDKINQQMTQSHEQSKKKSYSPFMHAFGAKWSGFVRPGEEIIFKKTTTGVSLSSLKELGLKILEIPPDFNLHPKLAKILDTKKQAFNENKPVDWSLAETLAYATLIHEGYPVRLTGQDTARGTFSHRHAVFHDFKTGQPYCPLSHIHNGPADFEIINSPLSEYAALGFEWGQSMANPRKLTIWEAQYGDFINGAQIIIDQFITSSAFKWQRYSGLTLLLPHGYEGQGPEHSSARLERFLQASAQNNIQVCYPTTPAQFFHLLRRQIHRPFRIPLIIMSPKSLLRHPLVTSTMQELAHGSFEEILDDTHRELKKEAKTLIFCSGKIYYDLIEQKEKLDKKILPLIRLEQFYPFPKDRLAAIIDYYKHAKEIIWCQEGPQNAEGWNFIAQNLSPLLKPDQHLKYVGRSAKATPADSYVNVYRREQKKIIETIVGDL